MQALREMGCKFALDDFGIGMCSYSYLKHFPVDFLKIDGSFVHEILRDPIDRELVRSITTGEIRASSEGARESWSFTLPDVASALAAQRSGLGANR